MRCESKLGLTEPFWFFLYMLGFIRFINLTFIVTLNVSSFLWEYWYLLIPEICNLGHGNYHRVAISKTFTKRLHIMNIQNLFWSLLFSIILCQYFLFYFVQTIFQYHVASIFSCCLNFKLWGRSISSEAFLKSFRNTGIESECKQNWPWTSLYMDGTAIFDLPTWGGPLNPYNVTQTHSIFLKLFKIILKVREWTFFTLSMA
jgi:hypothetical protein